MDMEILKLFLAQFENCATYCKWSDEDKAAHLRWALTGTAAQLLWGAEDLSYQGLLEKLKLRFSGKGMEEKYQTELRCRRRNQGEALRELAQDIRRLMTLAYPGEKSSLSQQIARDSFLAALGDTELELKIREREPQDLDEALCIAQRIEVFKNAVEASASGCQRVNRQVVDCKSDDKPATDIESRLEKLEREMSKQMSAVLAKSEQPTRKQWNNHRSARQDSNHCQGEASKKVDELEAVCKAADQEIKRVNAEMEALSKEVGRLCHLEQMRATLFQSQAPKASTQTTTSRSRCCCFSCGEQGHFARECPQQMSSSQGQMAGNRSQPGFSDQRPRRVNVTLNQRRHNAVGATYLCAKLGDKMCDCLLDTGSEVTLIPARVAKDAEITETSYLLSAANGTRIAVLGKSLYPLALASTTVL